MPDLPQDANENVCWTCGAPADPGCAQYVRLTAPARDHKDGQGYPVSRHKYGDTVVVHIPRCKDCRNRERLALVLFLVITLVYLVAFGVLASLNVIGGAAVVVIVGGAASFSVLYAGESGEQKSPLDETCQIAVIPGSDKPASLEGILFAGGF